MAVVPLDMATTSLLVCLLATTTGYQVKKVKQVKEGQGVELECQGGGGGACLWTRQLEEGVVECCYGHLCKVSTSPSLDSPDFSSLYFF